MECLKVTKLDERAVVPARATDGSAGYDLSALLDGPLTIKAGMSVLVPTGIAVELPGGGYGAFVFARSGLAVKHGIALSNGVGVVDSDYRGEIKVGLVNLSGRDYILEPFERVAQLVVLPVCAWPVVEAQALGGTARGAGGFGSTGR